MKLSIKAEATQIIANLEASQTSDQTIISESLDVQPPVHLLSNKTPYGDRMTRASLSGNVTIRYLAIVEINLRHRSRRLRVLTTTPPSVNG